MKTMNTTISQIKSLPHSPRSSESLASSPAGATKKIGLEGKREFTSPAKGAANSAEQAAFRAALHRSQETGSHSQLRPQTTTVGPRRPSAPSRPAMIERVLHASKSMDQLIARCSSGSTLRPQDLLALQARLYEGTTTLQLFSKTLETSTAATRQLLGSSL